MLFFTQLSNRLSKEKVFYIMISLFLLFLQPIRLRPLPLPRKPPPPRLCRHLRKNPPARPPRPDRRLPQLDLYRVLRHVGALGSRDHDRLFSGDLPMRSPPSTPASAFTPSSPSAATWPSSFPARSPPQLPTWGSSSTSSISRSPTTPGNSRPDRQRPARLRGFDHGDLPLAQREGPQVLSLAARLVPAQAQERRI